MIPTTYAIGDIHGRLDLLDLLIDLVEADAAARGTPAKVVFTGDYVDRGPDSFGVVERLIAGPRRPCDSFVCLRGNHDALFVQAVDVGPHVLPEWARIMFRHTIASYGAGEADWTASPRLRRHAAHLAALPLTHDDGTHLFVHAGIRPGVPIEEQTEEDLVWIREPFLAYGGPLPRRIVHGHTIMGDEPVVTANRISLDTGAYRSGILVAAVLAEGEVSFLRAVGAMDRGALVREELLAARISGTPVPAHVRDAYDAFVAGTIDLAEMTARTRRLREPA